GQLADRYRLDRGGRIAPPTSPHPWHVGSGIDDRRHGDRVRNLSCPGRCVASSWKFRTGCISSLAGRRTSFPSRRAHLRRAQCDEAAGWWTLRLYPRLLRTVPRVSLRLDDVLR